MRELRVDQVLVKDRIESKPRLTGGGSLVVRGWIRSLSKIALRANHDTERPDVVYFGVDQVLVKDRIESKPRQEPVEGGTYTWWIRSLSKIALRANHDHNLAVQNKPWGGSGPCQRSH